MKQPTRLLMIRHAQSVANLEQRAQGWGDDPLSAAGADQAQQLGRWLRANNPGAHVLFASPLQRARQTAAAVEDALDLRAELRAGLKEINLGQLEGISTAAFVAALQADTLAAYGGESDRAFAERVLGTLHGLLAAYDGHTLVVVTHMGVICMALAYWLKGDINGSWRAFQHIPNTAMTELVFGQQVEMVRYGSTPHLAEEPSLA